MIQINCFNYNYERYGIGLWLTLTGKELILTY